MTAADSLDRLFLLTDRKQNGGLLEDCCLHGAVPGSVLGVYKQKFRDIQAKMLLLKIALNGL